SLKNNLWLIFIQSGIPPCTLGDTILAGTSEDESDPPPQPAKSKLLTVHVKIERLFIQNIDKAFINYIYIQSVELYLLAL
ncbi:hypothetical protein AB6C61_23240, partial [Vibrio splendidus]